MAIPLLLGAAALWNLAGFAEPIQWQTRTQEAQLAVARPVSGVEVPPTLQPAAPITPTPAPMPSSTPVPIASVTAMLTLTGVATADTGTGQAPSQPTFAPTRVSITTSADPGHAPVRARTKGKHRG